MAEAVHSCRLEQVIAGVVEQLGVGPHTVGGVLRAELLNAASNLHCSGVQQLHSRVVLKGGHCPQRVGNLLAGVLRQGVGSPLSSHIQNIPESRNTTPCNVPTQSNTNMCRAQM